MDVATSAEVLLLALHRDAQQTPELLDISLRFGRLALTEHASALRSFGLARSYRAGQRHRHRIFENCRRSPVLDSVNQVIQLRRRQRGWLDGQERIVAFDDGAIRIDFDDVVLFFQFLNDQLLGNVAGLHSHHLESAE